MTVGAGVEAPALSVVVPVYDEAPNLPLLFDELREALDALGRSAEIVFVDDGSSDGSVEIVRRLGARDPRVRLVRLRRHAGLTAAFDAGFRAARGAVIVTLDADLQNDPRDIPRLLAALEGADAVTGWRYARQDPWLKRISSRVANVIRNVLIGERIHDGACSLRAIRRDCLDDLPPFNGMHRFIPTLLRAAGRRVIEMPVHHRPRRFGRSHFGVRDRALVVIQDLLVLRWMVSRRLAWEVVDDREPAGLPVLRAGPSAPGPRRALEPGAATARRLAAFWVGVALLLAGWGLLTGQGPTRDLGAGTTAVTLFPQRPAGSLISLWLRWDGPPGSAGWAVLESSERWSASAEMYWRRRIHPGWNYLLWPDVSHLAADEPTRLRFDEGAQAAWRISAARVDPEYGLRHLAPIRGALMALALTALIAVVDMTSAVKRHDDARTGCGVAS